MPDTSWLWIALGLAVLSVVAALAWWSQHTLASRPGTSFSLRRNRVIMGSVLVVTCLVAIVVAAVLERMEYALALLVGALLLELVLAIRDSRKLGHT